MRAKAATPAPSARMEPDAAAAVAADSLQQLAPGDRPLVVDEPSGHLLAALSSQGTSPQAWLRMAGGPHPATAWPAPGPYSSAFLRLAKAKDALDFTLHAAASMLAPGAPIVVFGANDEGIRSVPSRLDAVVEAVTTVDTRRHCRVLAGARRAAIADLKARLADWRRETAVSLPASDGGDLVRSGWVSYPGLFAAGRLDEGSALLLAHLPELAADARVLDFGCGSGLIAAGVQARRGATRIDMLDADALAIAAARENVPEARHVLGDGLRAAGRQRYDAILSNPPLHDGVAEHHGVLEGLIAQAPQHLVPGGTLQIVVQQRVKAGERMRAVFGNVRAVALTRRFAVWASTRT